MSDPVTIHPAQAADALQGHARDARVEQLLLAGLDHYFIGHYAQAIELYEHAVAIIPQPEFLAGLGDLYSLTDRPGEAEQQYATVEFIGKLAEINQVVYNRQLALFSANHQRNVSEALTLASTELADRKDVYGYDAAAWALYKNGRDTEAAQQVIDSAVQMHGGAGVTKGVKVEELYRDIRALRIYEGASEVQRQIIARDLLKENRA